MGILGHTLEKLSKNVELTAQALNSEKKEDEAREIRNPLPMLIWGKQMIVDMFTNLGKALGTRVKKQESVGDKPCDNADPKAIQEEVIDTFRPIIETLNFFCRPDEDGRTFRLVTLVREEGVKKTRIVEATIGRFDDCEEDVYLWFKGEGDGLSFHKGNGKRWADVIGRRYTVTIPVQESADFIVFQGKIGHRLKDSAERRKALDPLPKGYYLGDVFKTGDFGMVLRGIYNKFDLGCLCGFTTWKDFETEVLDRTHTRDDLRPSFQKKQKKQEFPAPEK